MGLFKSLISFEQSLHQGNHIGRTRNWENEKGTLKITNNAQQIVCDEMAAVGIKCISCTSGAVGSSKVDIINEKRQSHVYYMLIIE